MPDIVDESVIASLFPDEVITRALVRDVRLPYGAGTMALITLDNAQDHTRPNTFGPAGLLALRDALDSVGSRATPEAGEQRIAAVGVTGKPFVILGAGWPFHLGGITPYLDRSGITEKVTGTRFRL